MTYMPHIWHRGPLFGYLQYRLADPAKSDAELQVERRSVLMELANGDWVAKSSTLAGNAASAANMDAVTGSKAIDRRVHMYDDWFGYEQVGGTWAPVAGAATTGWWKGWQGDAFEIFRKTLINAIELSVADNRCWGLSFDWVCGAPKLEGWITWGRTGDGPREGHVQAVLVTPGSGYHQMFSRLKTAQVTTSNRTYAFPGDGAGYGDIEAATDTAGVAVVGHEFVEVQQETATGGWAPSSSALQNVLPTVNGTIRHVGLGQVVAVRPAEWDGGTPREGRPW